MNVSGNKTTTLIGTYGTYKRVGGTNTTLSNYSYTYDTNGNIQTVTDSDGKVITYTYDQQNQLVRADDQKSGTTTTYAYDVGGNITGTKTYAYTTGALGAQTASNNYTYGNSNWKDLLTGYNGQTITYDAIGNPLTYRDGLSFTWNGRQMSSAKNGSSTSNYTYNNDGIRTSKTVGGVTTKYFVDGSTILAQQTGNDVLWFMYDSDGARVGFTYNGTAYYYTTNAQGDVTGVVDNDRNVVVQYSYDSWGKLLSTTGSLASTIGSVNPFRYRGYYYDNETGLYYLNSRYYDANTGRFVNVDGQLNSGSDLSGMNMFSYCGNQPVNRIDTDGHSWWDVALVCAAVAVVCAVAVVAAPALAVAGAGIAISTAAVTAIAYVGYVAATVSIISCGIAATQTVAYSIPHSTPKVKTQSKEKSIAKTKPSSNTKIYRYGGTNPGSLTPSKHDVDLFPITGKGLSFSTRPPDPGQKAAVTTIEALNATGVVYAVQDGLNHVSVHPIGGTLADWYNAGSGSVWTIAVKSAVIKWDGVN